MHVVSGPICACHGQRDVGWVTRGDVGHPKATHRPEEGLLLLCHLGCQGQLTFGSYTFLVRPPEIRLLTPQNKQRLGAMQHFLTQ